MMAKKAFVTGITGFAGSYLAEHLLGLGYEVSGTYLSQDSLKNVDRIREKIKLFQVDLNDDKKVERIFSEEKKDFIFHLAALTSPKESFENPKGTVLNNISSLINILEALRKQEAARFLLVSSSDVYGAVEKENLPIKEDTPFNPSNPYAVSKIAQDFLGLQYFRSYNLDIVRVRPFNHIGPKQSPSFVVSAFAKEIAEIEKGKKEPVLKVGNLSARRDFTDVRDMVKAYELLLKRGKEGEVYNVGSGESHPISEILEKLLSFSKEKIKVIVDKSKLRPSDTPDLVSDSTKFRALTGWKPQIRLDESLLDTLEYWRNLN